MSLIADQIALVSEFGRIRGRKAEVDPRRHHDLQRYPGIVFALRDRLLFGRFRSSVAAAHHDSLSNAL
jgi:hypothetical protein